VDDRNDALLLDLYELTMLQSFHQQGMNDVAVFDLFIRRLPSTRNYAIACGLESALRYLETVSFCPDHLSYLKSLNRFSTDFIDYLGRLRFTGDVYAVAEGTPVFANEPIIEVAAPIAEAQFVETFLMNQIHLATLAASKAARVVASARGRDVVDFGLRRIHGTDAGLKTARAFYIAGVDSTSNVLAGAMYRIPVSGTMAHSYIQAHDSERDAFRHFLQSYPDGVLLVDTYDVRQGVQNVIEVAREIGPEFRAAGIRIDSGDLTAMANESRQLLDQAGLRTVKIFASGSLDEYTIESLLAAGAPIDGFGVGTHMGTSSDSPFLDTVYKLVEYANTPRTKSSPGKTILPGRKQVFREFIDGTASRDVIACFDETLPGEALLKPVMKSGHRLAPLSSVEVSRRHCLREIQRLPKSLLRLTPAEPPYAVNVSPKLAELETRLRLSSFEF
jgi:nicotinate phosphoribosyltransferase